jgi:hypothetical protein
MDNDERSFRSVLDYFGFLAYATILGGGVPPQELLDAAHPRSRRLARVSRASYLTVVARNDAPTPAPAPDPGLDLPDERVFTAA